MLVYKIAQIYFISGTNSIKTKDIQPPFWKAHATKIKSPEALFIIFQFKYIPVYYTFLTQIHQVKRKKRGPDGVPLYQSYAIARKLKSKS